MKLAIFHYHLLPGGVTDVIVNSVNAVLEQRSDISSVTLVCGRTENTAAVRDRIHSGGVPVAIEIIADLDYTSRAESDAVATARAQRLTSVLIEMFNEPGALWWVHNYHLGKNPSFTRALTEIAARDDGPRMVLHIHDFPECARFENLEYLNRVVEESAYPSTETVRYVVINERDYDLLRAAGIPEHRLFLLVNPLPLVVDRDVGSRENLAAALQEFARGSGHAFNPDKPILLYPIRCIRRKNVLELGLLARIAGDMNLVTTLPGVSEPERVYSSAVKNCYVSGLIRGVFGIGRHEAEVGTSFEELTHRSDVIVSSSVQEGFGMLFVNALLWRVPLFARDLPVLGAVKQTLDSYPAHFYKQVRVPMRCPSVSSFAAYVKLLYGERIAALDGQVPSPVLDRLNAQVEERVSQPTIDFGFLPVDMQLAVLRDLSDPGFMAKIQGLNKDLVDRLVELADSDCPDVSHEVQDRFGLESFALAFGELLDSFDKPGEPWDGSRVQANLVERFADLDYLRLLLAPLGHNHED